MQIVKITDCDVCFTVELDTGEVWICCKRIQLPTQTPLTDKDHLIAALCGKILELENQNGTIKNTQS